MLKVTLIRIKDDGKQTIGRLIACDEKSIFTCCTMERPWLDNANNVSSIPKDTYQVLETFSNRFQKLLYEVTGVLNRTSCRIHPANYARQLEGCIALGDGFTDIDKDGELDVTNSVATVDKFMSFMNNQPFELTII